MGFLQTATPTVERESRREGFDARTDFSYGFVGSDGANDFRVAGGDLLAFRAL